jgi:UDP-N-acetyl-D-galactosamine dehydrogenase
LIVILTTESEITVVGLGYVGLPLAVAFAKKRITIGFDLNPERISQLQSGIDLNLEVSSADLLSAKNLKVTNKISDIEHSNVYVITVPTPIDDQNIPNFDYLVSASEIVGSVLKENDIVIYESTVYPGATEEICVPVLENISRLKFNQNFYVGYSPERINPGDSTHKLGNTTKIISGSTPETVSSIKSLYEEIISAEIFVASSIKVAEAAKIIENTQRDLNIALVNDLAKLFYTLGIDTHEILEAAATKWNFQKFTPGLVGGHCIGVDPYYLTHKAKMVNHSPDLILAGRETNNSMSEYVAQRVKNLFLIKGKNIVGSSCLVLGLAFKENCPDLRNSGAYKLILELGKLGLQVDVCDPLADVNEAKYLYNLDLVDLDKVTTNHYEAVVLAVSHSKFSQINEYFLKIKEASIIFDIKGVLPRTIVTERL